MSEILSAQLTVIATLALAVFAFITAIFAWLAFGKQSREVSLLLEQNKRDTDERRRAQASQVFVWATLEGPRQVYHVRNTSPQPIYDLRIKWNITLSKPPDSGSEWRDGPLMPGEEHTCRHISLTLASAFPEFVEATFRDSAGVWWRTGAEGRPEELPPLPAQLPSDGASAQETAP